MAHPPTTTPHVQQGNGPVGPAGPVGVEDVPAGFVIPPSVFTTWEGFTTALTQGLPHGVNRAAVAARAMQRAVK